MTRDTSLDAIAIQQAAGTKVIGREVIVITETESTNDHLLTLVRPETPEGLVVFAETQTRGRGQRGNQWISPGGVGLWFSMLLRPRIALAESPRVTTWLARRIAATVQSHLALPATVKPPNDVLIGNRKIAGILVEMRAVENAPHIAIAGVGLNVNQREEDFLAELRDRAASLAMFTGTTIDRENFAAALLRDFDRTYAAVFGSDA